MSRWHRRRASADFLIVGRTDAAFALGLDAAIARANALAAIGADLVCLEHPYDREAIERVARKAATLKLVSQVSGKGDTPPAAQLAAMGCRMVTWPAEAQFGAIAGARDALERRLTAGTPSPDGGLRGTRSDRRSHRRPGGQGEIPFLLFD